MSLGNYLRCRQLCTQFVFINSVHNDKNVVISRTEDIVDACAGTVGTFDIRTSRYIL